MTIPQILGGNSEPSSKWAVRRALHRISDGPAAIWSRTQVTAGVPRDCWHQSGGIPLCPSIPFPPPPLAQHLSLPIGPGSFIVPLMGKLFSSKLCLCGAMDAQSCTAEHTRGSCFWSCLKQEALDSDCSFLRTDSSVSVCLSSAHPETCRHPSCGRSGGFSDRKDAWAPRGWGWLCRLRVPVLLTPGPALLASALAHPSFLTLSV